MTGVQVQLSKRGVRRIRETHDFIKAWQSPTLSATGCR
jgi:hypothetical protein